MKIRQKAARLVMTHISDRSWDDFGDECRRLERDIEELGVGGFCLFGGNVDRTPDFIAAMRGLADHRLLVGSDLERGAGQQLEGATVFPSLMMCGATGDPNLAFAQGCVTAVEARAAGINLVFAPVADVHTEDANPIIGVRAFGSEPRTVAEFVAAFVRGLERAGVVGTVKHFPGHGDTRRDSHIELPVVDADRATLESRELVPFRAAFAESVKAVMTAHVEYPALDSGPATLSRAIMTDLLRGDLGFRGLVVTDALLMGGIAEVHGPGEAAVRALEAGVDVLLMPADAEATVEGVANAVESGRLTEERLDDSIARIEQLLDWSEACPMPEPPYDVLPRELADTLRCHLDGTEADLWGESRSRVAAEIATCGVTWIKGDPKTTASELAACDPASVVLVAIHEVGEFDNFIWLRSEFEAAFPGGRFASACVPAVSRADDSAEAGPCESELCVVDTDGHKEEVLAIASASSHCIIALFDEVTAWKGHAGFAGPTRDLVKSIVGAVPHTTALLFAAPWYADVAVGSGAVLCCWDGSRPAQLAALGALLGVPPEIPKTR